MAELTELKRTIRTGAFLLLFILTVLNTTAQQVTWGLSAGSSQTDYVENTYVDASHNVFICGEFRGTNVDFDPSAGTANLSAAGGCDGFLVQYNSAGQYLRSMSIGGSNLDKINAVATDAAGNIYITGYFRGSNVDFDPGPGNAFLSSNGENGTDNGFGGDIFVAKYTSNMQYVWAFNIGGSTLRDNGLQIRLDNSGNILLTGTFQGNVDFNPGAGSNTLNSGSGTAFVAKYTSAGVYVWAINMGAADTDNVIYDVRTDASDNVVVAGFFQGSGIDFDPGPGMAILNCNGGYDGFVAKYNSSGQYIWAFNIGSFGVDVIRGFTMDASGNIYVVGDFNSTVDFDPGAGTHNLTSNGSSDVFVAKYSAAGNYVWAFNVGSAGTELGWRIATDNSNLYVTGGLYGTADFDPSPATDNLTTNGGADIFLAKYDFTGNYICGFNVGSTQDDYGFGVATDGTDKFYLAGYLQGTNVDFAPTPSVYNLSSNGGPDAFLVKYLWPAPTTPVGTMQGNTICNGTGNGQLTFTATSGTSPFTLTYTDGTTTWTQTNVYSGVPFNVAVNPTVTTNYTVSLVLDAVRCSPQQSNPVSATITVGNPNVQASGNSPGTCTGGSVNLNATGANIYVWSPATGLSNPNIANPVATPAATTTYTVTGTAAGGCSNTASVTVTVYTKPAITKSADTLICTGSSVQLHFTGGQTYVWTPAATLDNPNISNPLATPVTATTYYLTYTDTHNCPYQDSVKVGFKPAPVFAINPSKNTCLNVPVNLLASGGDQYVWTPGTGLSNTAIANPVANPGTTTTYTVSITETQCGQSSTLNTTVTVNPLPQITASKSNDLDCSVNQATLTAGGASTYTWTPATGLSTTTGATIIASPAANTVYTVTGTDVNGCSNTANVQIFVTNAGSGLYLVPSAFTPNGDGKNDCFGLTYWGIITRLDFSVYSRWGDRLFHTTDPSACWDGTYKGKAQDPGVYIYVIKAATTCAPEVFRKGTVTLIR